jgi:hypothetical protein
MLKTRATISAVLFLSAAVVAPALVAAPVLAEGAHAYRHHSRVYRHHGWGYGQRDYSGYLDPSSGHYDPEFQRNRENFGFSGRDPSRIGGEDPSLHPVPY